MKNKPVDIVPKKKVKMRFTEDKFYTDMTKAHFEKGKIYEVEGSDMIDRWLKRGGEIVEEVQVMPIASPSETQKSPEHVAAKAEKIEDNPKLGIKPVAKAKK